MALTLSGIQGWTPDHLDQVADYFIAQANQSQDVFGQAHSQLTGITWDGHGGDGARGRSESNLKAVKAHAAELRATAKTMQSEAEAIANAKNEVTALVQRFKDQEFSTGEDFVVTDAKQGQSPQMQTIRKLYAQEYTGQLATKVAAFEAATGKAAGTIGEHTAELAGFNLPASQPTPHPFLPKWQQEITDPGPQQVQPPLTVQTPNGTLNLLPPARDFPAPMPPNPFTGLHPPGLPPIPPGSGLPEGITDGVHHGLPALTPSLATGGHNAHLVGFKTDGGAPPIAPWDTPDPSPTGGNFLPRLPSVLSSPPSGALPPPMPDPQRQPLLPRPPEMTAMKPDDPWPYSPKPYVNQEIDLGKVATGWGAGCITGATGAAIAGAAVPAIDPIEPIAIPAACIQGGNLGALSQVFWPVMQNIMGDNDFGVVEHHVPDGFGGPSSGMGH